MKKMFSLLLAMLMLVSLLAACGAKTEPAAETKAEAETEAAAAETEAAPADLLAVIKERGTIVVGLEGDWAPWSFVGDDDALMGFDVEVAQAVAAKLGVTAEIVPGEWDGLFAGMDAGRYDIVVNGVEVTEERSEKYDFSQPYAYIRTALIVRGDNEDIKTFEDLNGKTTANSIASTYMVLAEEYGATVSGVDTLDETLTLVLQGRVDATLNAIVSFTDYMAQHPDANLKVVATTEDASLVSIPMVKGDYTASLRAAIDEAMAELHADGTISALSVKYFGEDISK